MNQKNQMMQKAPRCDPARAWAASENEPGMVRINVQVMKGGSTKIEGFLRSKRLDDHGLFARRDRSIALTFFYPLMMFKSFDSIDLMSKIKTQTKGERR